jgi:hypothetical protein
MPTVNGTPAPVYDGIREGAAELALRRHGFTGERLQKLARKVANDSLRGRGATLGDRFDDLVSSLCIVGMQAAHRYDPDMVQTKYGQNGGEPFASYVADVMEHRIVDFYRKKSEGFADRRRGLDGLVTLDENIDTHPGKADTEEPDPKLLERWGTASLLLRKPMLKWDRMTERRAFAWQRAADAVDLDLEELFMITMDRAAKQIERTAA